MADSYELHIEPARPHGAVLLAEPTPDDAGTALLIHPLPEQPGPIRWMLRLSGRLIGGIFSILEWLFGALTLMVGLAVLAALPVVQFLSLGYLLEAGARVARSGRLRDGFIGARLAARVGGAAAASWLLLLPVRLIAGIAYSAQVIEPGGDTARAWRIGLIVLIAFTALHIVAACARGGRLRYFVWPFNFVWLLRRLFRGGYYTEARDATWDFVASLRLPYYFWLGFRGFVAAFAWLVIPVTLLALGRAVPLLGFVGALALAWVLLYLPFLQLRMATENRLAAAFELRQARREFCRAPWAYSIAFVITLALALPLYLLKIEVVPAEAAWLPSLIFIMFIFPARLLTGWALSRARRRDTYRHWFFRWTGRLPFIPAALIYVLVLYFTQYTSWNGVWSLYEQHAFLVPVPFFGM
ncbi:MAG: hypothetical protein L0Y71_15235 [Gemmataceae bacterium]|nr:hypothetical protein [Gemmataceae bacterium]